MRTWTRIVGCGAVISLWGGCLDPVGFASAKPVPLSYVGQISFGPPVRSNHDVVIPVSYAGGQWLMNSAWVPYGMDVKINGNVVLFTDAVSLPGSNRPNAVRKIVLPRGTHGVLQLKYGDPDGTTHELGSVDVGE